MVNSTFISVMLILLTPEADELFPQLVTYLQTNIPFPRGMNALGLHLPTEFNKSLINCHLPVTRF